MYLHLHEGHSSAVVWSGSVRLTVLSAAASLFCPAGGRCICVAVFCTVAMHFVQHGYTIVAQSSTLLTCCLYMRRWETEVATNLRQEALYR